MQTLKKKNVYNIHKARCLPTADAPKLIDFVTSNL